MKYEDHEVFRSAYATEHSIFANVRMQKVLDSYKEGRSVEAFRRSLMLIAYASCSNWSIMKDYFERYEQPIKEAAERTVNAIPIDDLKLIWPSGDINPGEEEAAIFQAATIDAVRLCDPGDAFSELLTAVTFEAIDEAYKKLYIHP